MSDSDNNKGSRQSAAPLNSDNVEAILSRLMLTWQAFILEQPEPKDRLDAKEAKAALLVLLEAEAVDGFLTVDDMFTRAEPRRVKAIPLERIKELLGG